MQVAQSGVMIDGAPHATRAPVNPSQRNSRDELRAYVPSPPPGWQRFSWYGPGLLWMISSVGSGSVLFTPRVGSRYQYSLLWLALAVIFLMWVMVREVGRYTVVTGKTILDGYRTLPGPRGWAIWMILLPQMVAAVVTMGGIAALAGSALMIALPGSQAFYAAALIVTSTVIVLSGRYAVVEHAASLMALILVLAAAVTAMRVLPEPTTFGGGLLPGIPENLDVYFVLPWVGFILAGAAGVMWYSYWVAARGYGGETTETGENAKQERDAPLDQRIERLQAWMRVMSNSAAVGVFGGGLVIISFLILGAELLAPQGIVPEGIGVAEDLARLLSEVWGVFGFWLLIVGVTIALAGTVLANQDGWSRMFADATMMLLPRRWREANKEGGVRVPIRWMTNRLRLKQIYLVTVTAALPLLVFFLVRRPVEILSVGGIVAAAHTPVVVFLTLYLNKTRLPRELRPGVVITTLMVLAGLFFLAFAVLHLLNLVDVNLLPKQ